MNEKLGKYLGPILIAIIIGVSVILSSVIVISGISNMKNKENIIAVTGSAKKTLKSNFVKWKGCCSFQSSSLKDAYEQIQKSVDIAKKYLISNGVNPKDMVVTSTNTTTNYKYLPNGQLTNIVDTYKLDQYIEVKSNDVDKITEISRKSTELINQGIVFQSMAPEYYYTKIADLKVNMLSEATKNAKERAIRIAKSTDSTVGSLRAADMGVFQITPAFSNDVTDSGVNDTSSIDKEITAVVNCSFEIK